MYIVLGVLVVRSEVSQVLVVAATLNTHTWQVLYRRLRRRRLLARRQAGDKYPSAVVYFVAMQMSGRAGAWRPVNAGAHELRAVRSEVQVEGCERPAGERKVRPGEPSSE